MSLASAAAASPAQIGTCVVVSSIETENSVPNNQARDTSTLTKSKQNEQGQGPAAGSPRVWLDVTPEEGRAGQPSSLVREQRSKDIYPNVGGSFTDRSLTQDEGVSSAFNFSQMCGDDEGSSSQSLGDISQVLSPVKLYHSSTRKSVSIPHKVSHSDSLSVSVVAEMIQDVLAHEDSDTSFETSSSSDMTSSASSSADVTHSAIDSDAASSVDTSSFRLDHFIDLAVGKGGFAGVYLGKITSFAAKRLNLPEGTKVACKAFALDDGGLEGAEAEAQKELTALKACKSDYVVKLLLDFVLRTAQGPLIVLEPATKGDLISFLRQRERKILQGKREQQDQVTKECPLSVSEFLDFLESAFSGITYVHDCGLVHGDIKPENFLVWVLPDGSLVVKLADLGCAVRRSTSASGDKHSDDSNTLVVSTLIYQHIDLMTGPVSPAADFFAFALAIQVVLSGDKLSLFEKRPLMRKLNACLDRLEAMDAYTHESILQVVRQLQQKASHYPDDDLKAKSPHQVVNAIAETRGWTSREDAAAFADKREHFGASIDVARIAELSLRQIGRHRVFERDYAREVLRTKGFTCGRKSNQFTVDELWANVLAEKGKTPSRAILAAIKAVLHERWDLRKQLIKLTPRAQATMAQRVTGDILEAWETAADTEAQRGRKSRSATRTSQAAIAQAAAAGAGPETDN